MSPDPGAAATGALLTAYQAHAAAHAAYTALHRRMPPDDARTPRAAWDAFYAEKAPVVDALRRTDAERTAALDAWAAAMSHTNA